MTRKVSGYSRKFLFLCQKNQSVDQTEQLYNLFLKIDTTQVEVNLCGKIPVGQGVCIEDKVNFAANEVF